MDEKTAEDLNGIVHAWLPNSIDGVLVCDQFDLDWTVDLKSHHHTIDMFPTCLWCVAYARKKVR